jgi:hypothetical protein
VKHWEVDVVMRVCKTLSFGGPTTEDAARNIAQLAIDGSVNMVTLAKWQPDASGLGRHPVETIIDNAPEIVAIREVPE